MYFQGSKVECSIFKRALQNKPELKLQDLYSGYYI